MAKVIINKDNVRAWLKDKFCQGDIALYWDMTWALGSDLTAFEDACIATENDTLVSFEPENISDDFHARLQMLRTWFAYAHNDTEKYPDALKGQFNIVTTYAENKLKHRASSEPIIILHDDLKFATCTHNSITLSARDIAQILTFNTNGLYTLSIWESDDYGLHCLLQEQLSGLETEWSFDGEDGDTSFWGWRIENNGRGHFKKLFSNRVALAALMGGTTLSSEFNSVGSYAFAKTGFKPTRDSWNALRQTIEGRASDLYIHQKCSLATYEKVIALCQKDEPETLWELADLPDLVDQESRKIAQYLLFSNPWQGTFDLQCPKQINRLSHFAGRDTFKASIDNAARYTNSTFPHKLLG